MPVSVRPPASTAQTATAPAAGAQSADPNVRTYDLPGVGRQTYHFPSRFQQVELLNAQLVLPAKAVASWLPPGLEVASFAGVTRGMVTVQRLGKPPDGMKPYLEASLSVRVKGPDGGEGWHTLVMPVDSLENQQRGRVIFGYPKEMSQLSLRDTAHGRKGEVRSPQGEPLLSLEVDQRNPLVLPKGVENKNYQQLNGKLVSLESSGRGELRLGKASVTFGPELRRRFPGLPEKPTVLLGGSLSDAELALSLPSSVGASTGR